MNEEVPLVPVSKAKNRLAPIVETLAWNPDPNIRRNALLDIFALISWALAGSIHIFKEIEIDGILNTVKNSTRLSMDEIAKAAREITHMVRQNATTAPARPAIDARVLAADVFQIAFGLVGLVGVAAHRFKHERSRFGLFNQLLVAASAFFYLLFDTAINRVPSLAYGAQIGQIVTLSTGATGLILESFRAGIVETHQKDVAFPRGEQKIDSVETFVNRRALDGLITLLGSTTVALHITKDLILDFVDNDKIAAVGVDVCQFITTGLAGVSYLGREINQFDKKEDISLSGKFDRVTNWLLAGSLACLSFADVFVSSLPAPESAQFAKGVITCVFLLIVLTKFTKLMVEAITNQEINTRPCSGYSRL